MEKTNTKITRYEKDTFWIDIVDNGIVYEAWISEKSYGIATLMFGIAKEDISEDEFIDLVEGNFYQYAADYMAEYDDADPVLWSPADAVINEYGVEIDYDTALNLMDDELRERLSSELAPCSDQEFFNAYCEAHEEKYGEPWELAKANPVY